MDIKDFILIGGGILIAMVVGHGFWIAWRAKREPLRLDIVPDLIPDDVDEIERLRGELPNGGARVVNSKAPDYGREDHSQENLELELDLAAPVLMDAQPVTTSKASSVRNRPSLTPEEVVPDAIVAEANTARTEPVVEANSSLLTESRGVQKSRPRVYQAPPRNSRSADTSAATEQPESSKTATAAVREVDIQTESRRTQSGRNDDRATQRSKVRKSKERTKTRESAKEEAAQVGAAPVPSELLVLNVLALKGQPFQGENLVNALRGEGLRYGDMNIFHRVDVTTKAKVFSVANAVEPGTFDLSDLATLQSPGMTFFLQLPGPTNALDAFNDMLQAAKNVSLALGGEIRDEDLSVLTGQTVEHMRQRIADFARRRLSKRA